MNPDEDGLGEKGTTEGEEVGGGGVGVADVISPVVTEEGVGGEEDVRVDPRRKTLRLREQGSPILAAADQVRQTDSSEVRVTSGSLQEWRGCGGCGSSRVVGASAKQEGLGCFVVGVIFPSAEAMMKFPQM